LSRWFQARVGAAKGRIRRIAIVALARKLLVALWRYVAQGVVRHPEEASAPDPLENTIRKHSTIGYLSPVEFERKVGLA